MSHRSTTLISSLSRVSFASFAAMIGLMISIYSSGASADAAADYQKNGKELLAMINSGKVDAGAAKKLAEAMSDSAMSLFADFVKKNPESAKLYEVINKDLSKLKGASFEVLQKDYHDAGKLPKSLVGVDLKAEDGEKYTDPLHTALHPLMTLRAIEKNDLKSAKEELNEGLEQCDNMIKHNK